jgi:Skp family chaperone for outer membrane proteins
MFRLLSRVLFAALFTAVSCIPLAAQNAAAQTGKIVWVNMEQAILSCDEGKNEFDEIQKFVEAKTADMDAKRKEFETLKNKLSVQGSKLTDQSEINRKRDNVTNYIVKRLQFVIDEVAREKGFAAVMVLNPNRDAWISPTLDITEELVKAYNAAHPVTAAKKEPLAE